MPEENEFVVVYVGNTIEADLVKSLLEGNGIAAFLKDEKMGTLAPWYVTPGGPAQSGSSSPEKTSTSPSRYCRNFWTESRPHNRLDIPILRDRFGRSWI